MSAKAREEKQMEFLKLRRDFEEKSRAFARKVDAAENDVRQGMAQNIFQAAETVAKQQNLDLIIDAASGSVMFAKPNMDITKAVLTEVNRIWKANGNRFPAAQSEIRGSACRHRRGRGDREAGARRGRQAGARERKPVPGFRTGACALCRAARLLARRQPPGLR